MAINNESLEDLTKRVRDSFSAYLPDSNSWLFPNNLWITATVLGGMIWELLSYVRKIPDLTMADTAPLLYLQRIGAQYGVTQTLASSSTGNVTVTADVGTVYPAGTVFTINTGQTFITQTAATVVTGTIDIPVISAETGSDQNLIAGTPVIISNTVAGHSASEASVGGVTGGLCDEDVEDYRERILLKMRSQARYGTLCDFKEWAMELEGVDSAWVRKVDGVIKVIVTLNGATIDEVNDYLNDDCRKPICAVVEALEAVQQVLSLTMTCEDLNDPETVTTVTDTLNDHLTENGYPGQSYSNQDLENALCVLGLDIAIGCGPFTPTSDDHIFTSINVVASC